MTADALSPIAGSHDLRLPAWGPYTKRYMGISHVPDVAAGLRFDLSVFRRPLPPQRQHPQRHVGVWLPSLGGGA